MVAPRVGTAPDTPATAGWAAEADRLLAPHGADSETPPLVQGVLFDLDDTLMDLKSAQLLTFEETVTRQAELHGHELPHQDRVDAAGLHFAADAGGHYQRYIDGELDFLGQRFARAADALSLLGLPAEPDPGLWSDAYEERVRSRWSLFPDARPLLDALAQAGVPWGVVTNNVEHYQRAKLEAVGLTEVSVVVGSDTARAPKPDPAPFWAGCSALGLRPDQVLYVGDNPDKDGIGARDAGLVSLLVLRDGAVPGDIGGGDGGTSSSDVPEGVWVSRSLSGAARFVSRSKPLL